MQEASGCPYRGISLSDGVTPSEGLYPPFVWGLLLPVSGLIGLPHIHTKSGGKAIGIVRVVVVDRAVCIHINKVSGVGGIRGTQPPIDGCTGYNPNHTARLPCFVAPFDF